MKKTIFFLLLLLMNMTLMAEQYKVTAETLNVRKAPSTSAKVIGKLQPCTVEVTRIENGWACIEYNGAIAYVSADYLQLVADNHRWKWVPRFTLGNVDWNRFEKGDIPWLAYVILFFALVLWVGNSSDNMLKVKGEPISYTLACAVALFYFIRMGDDCIWFCMSKEVSWLWAIVGFVLYAFVILAYMIAYSNVMYFVRVKAGDFSLSLGWGSWMLCMSLAVLASVFEWESWCFWVLSVLAICQLVQVVRIFIGVVPDGGIVVAILIVILYFLGLITITVLLVNFLVLLIIAVVIVLCFGAIANASTNSGKSSVDYDQQEREEQKKREQEEREREEREKTTIYPHGSWVGVRGKEDNWGNFEADNGDKYKYDYGDHEWYKKE